MGELVYNDENLIPWASKIIGFTPRSDAKAMGWKESGRLRAVVIWDNFGECDCNIHIAGDGTPHWFKRQFMIALFMHPFVQWNMRRVTGLVASYNTKSLRFTRHIGFVDEGYLKNALPDGDLVVLGMLREHCRFIPQQYRDLPWQPTQKESEHLGDSNG